MISIIQGDVIEVLKDYLDESFTACFCDPPYGLKFMGKEWDHGIPASPYWAEILRVLKPGAVLMAFSGTRTWHRLGVAIEDAGFELFDTMMWLHAQGMPKSHNIGKAIDKMAGRIFSGQSIVQLKRRLIALFNASGKTHNTIDEECGFRACNYLTLPGEGKRPDPWINILPSQEKWQQIKTVIGCDEDIGMELDELFYEAEREVVGQQTKARKTDSAFSLPTTGETEYRTWDITIPATDAAKIWDGYGTNLKPSFEPILLARKPRNATFAQTAMEHGSSALNIDGCRIPSAEPYVINTWDDGAKPFGDGAGHPFTGRQQNGRWPANLLFSHLPECKKIGVKKVKQRSGSVTGNEPSHTGDDNTSCYGEYGRVAFQRHADPDGFETVEAWECAEGCPVAMLDRQSGECGNKWKKNYGKKYAEQELQYAGGTFGGGGYLGNSTYSDKGGASRFFKTFEGERFFYTPKANKKERDAGLEGLSLHPPPASGRSKPAPGRQSALGAPRRNSHTTVKPLALCKYLATLIVPPEDYRDEADLLIPFAGVLSEAIGAVLAGWRNITTIELEKDYCEIGYKRINWWIAKIQETGLFDPKAILKT